MQQLKTLFYLSHVLVGIGAAYLFFVSDTKTIDLWMVPLGLMIMFDGLRMLLEDQKAAAANVSRRIRNGFFIVLSMVVVWSLLR